MREYDFIDTLLGKTEPLSPQCRELLRSLGLPAIPVPDPVEVFAPTDRERQRQAAFREAFGAFEDAWAVGLSAGCSEDGTMFGFLIERPDGTRVRVAFPNGFAHHFLDEMMRTLSCMAEQLEERFPEGPASGEKGG